MTLQGPRADFERALAKALSRYIGYTTAAYDLDRIFGVLSEFVTKPSAYEKEIVSSLRVTDDDPSEEESHKSTEEYLSETIHFATSLNLIELVSDRGATIKRYAPTQTGRSVMGARALADEEFWRFYRTKLVLIADADAIIPTLLLSRGRDSAEFRFGEYQRFHKRLRERRWNWLQRAFPETRLLGRMVEQLPWAKTRGPVTTGVRIEEISRNTARHHVTPRSRWLVQLGLAESPQGRTTRWGDAVLRALVGDEEYFWLGPTEGVQEVLRIPEDRRKGGTTEDRVQFCSRPRAPSTTMVAGLIEATAEIMMNAYESARLVYAPQAPLELPIEYIAYRSYAEEVAYSWQDILAELFMKYRSHIERLSARKGPIGFYKVRDTRA